MRGGFLDIPQRNTRIQRGVFGGSVRVSPGLILLKGCGLIALRLAVILVARSPALPRRHRSRPRV